MTQRANNPIPRKNQSLSRPVSQHGFSLIELLVTMFIVSLLLAIGGPQFSQFLSNNRMAASINELNISLHVARTEAIKRNSFVSLCPSSNWDDPNPTCDAVGDFSEGWIVFIDADFDGAPDLTVDNSDNVLQAHPPIYEGMDLTAGTRDAVLASSQFISYAPSGRPLEEIAGNPAVFNIQLCDHRGSIDTGSGIAAGRWINISPTGRPQMHRSTDALGHANNILGGCSYMSGG